MKVCVVVLVLILVFTGCVAPPVNSVEQETDEYAASMFVIAEDAGRWRVVYHRDTKVMYAVSDGSYNYGTFTLLVNADGSPMVYEE